MLDLERNGSHFEHEAFGRKARLAARSGTLERHITKSYEERARVSRVRGR